MILVIGATGTQGGHVIDALLTEGREVAALTRDPTADAARALAERGVTLRAGNLDDRESLTEAFEDIEAVFYPSLHPNERERGGYILAALRDAGVPFLVASTGGNCDDRPGVEHVDAKADVEEAIQETEQSAFVIRPHTFMSNFRMQEPAIYEGRLPYPLPGGRAVPLVDPADIGRLAAHAFAAPERYAGETVELAAGTYTIDELAEAFATALGRPVEPKSIPFETFAERMGAPEAFARFLEWQTSHDVDIKRLTREFEFQPTTFRTYLDREWTTA